MKSKSSQIRSQPKRGQTHPIQRNAIVRWPHHGGNIDDNGSAHEMLVDLLRPATMIVSVGARGGHDYPSPEFFAAARGSSARLLCTQATAGCLGGRGGGGTCAGTIRIYEGADGVLIIDPDLEEHQVVIATLETAQCVDRT